MTLVVVSVRTSLAVASLLAIALFAGDAHAQAPTAPPPPVAPPAPVPPHLLGDGEVAYPDGATGEARVRLVVTVGPDGRVADVIADETSAPAVFRDAAVRAVREFRYEPATRGGKPITAKIRIEVAFHPSEPAAPPAPTREPAPSVDRRAAPEPEEVRVRGERAEPGRSATLARAEVRQIPGVFGDPFRAIEVLPGVTPILSGLPFFYVRGAPPGDVGYFLDGVRVPLLFHVGAGPSVVHPALISRVDLYPGGYPARFGRFSGGIVSGETAPPEETLHGEYNVRLFDAGAMIETPFDGGRGSVLAGGRYSYTAALLTQLSPDTTLDYWDYQARASYDLTSRDRLTVFSFGSYDFLGQRTQTETLTAFGTEFHRVDLRYDHKLGSTGTIRTAVTLGLDRSLFQQDRYAKSRMLGVRTEVDQRLSDRARVRFGTDVELTRYDIDAGQNDLGPSASSIATTFPSRSDVSTGARADLVLRPARRFEITPGLRVDVFTSDGASALGLDPRLATRTELSDTARILVATGIAHQPPSFVLPAPGVQPGGLRGGLQASLQESAGLELDLGAATTATLTAFHNGFFSMSDALGVQPRQATGCPPGAYRGGSFGADRGLATNQGGGGGGVCANDRFKAGTFGPDRTGGGGEGADSQGAANTAQAFAVRTRGSAYGLELFVKRKLTSRLGGFVSYTLSRSTRAYDTSSFVSSFDRTHVGNAAVGYDLGRGWRAGTRVVFYTGLPASTLAGAPPSRLPAFFRLDLRLEKRWRLGERAWISGVAEWMNATLSKEAISTRCTLQGCEAQTVGPVTIPSLGVEGGF